MGSRGYRYSGIWAQGSRSGVFSWDWIGVMDRRLCGQTMLRYRRIDGSGDEVHRT